MKNSIKTLFLFILIITILIPTPGISASSDNVTVYINGKLCHLDKPAVAINGRTLVPMRSFFEAMGSKVIWEAKTKTAVAIRQGTVVRLPIGSISPTVNEKAAAIDVPAQLVGNSTYIPLRFTGEAFGGQVDWDAPTRTVRITLSENKAYVPLTLDAVKKVVNVPADYPTIQEGIDAASNGSAILVSNGIYHENLYFHGKDIIVASLNGPEKTTIDGNALSTVVSFISGETNSAMLYGFTVTNGLANASPFGGGIHISDSSPTIA